MRRAWSRKWRSSSNERVMKKQIGCAFRGKTSNIGWLSFQPSGFISVGLNDPAFVAPRANWVAGLFNAYDRVYRAEFMVSPDGAGSDPIRNPHFTYHPPGFFHLRGNGDDAVFKGVARMDVV